MPEDGSKAARSTVTSHEGSLRTVTRGTAPDLPPRLGHFRIEACIGRGGLGIVYRARDQKLRRHVALKVLAETSESATARLLEEARAAASLMHPSIAAIHDVQQHRGVTFIVMELVEGTTLREEIQQRRIPIDAALRYAREIAAGLARAHDSGIIHRDLKPENVMVTPDGGIKILDFGLAREAPEAPPDSSDLTRTGIAGTPGYMAPEQAVGHRVDARADVFSFGVVLWEMLSGRRPTDRDGRVASTDLLAEGVPGVSPELARFVERCLNPSRSARFTDAAMLLEEFSSIEPPGRRVSAARRLPFPMQLVAFGALAAVVLGFGMRDGGQPPVASASDAPAPPLAPSGAAPALTLTSAPEPLTTVGTCSDFPVFADDGSIAYARHEEHGVALHRLDPDSGEDTELTDAAGISTRPAAGAPGSIVYLFQERAEAEGTEVREVSLRGGPPSTLVRGSDPAFVASTGALLYLQADGRTVRSRMAGESDVLLYDSPSSTIFDSLVVSPSGRWLATGRATAVPRPGAFLCFGSATSGDAGLDCTTAGSMTSRRPAFGPRDRSLYFARDAAIVRFDVDSHAVTSVPVTPAPTTLAIAPDGTSAVFSSCRRVFDAFRVAADGRLDPLPIGAEQAGLLNVGPRGELAFPVARAGRFALGVVDAGASDVRVLTGAEQSVVEMAFSPDGRRLAFHDATEGTGGIFVVDADGATQPTRLTADADDNLPSWLDAERVLYMRAEKGLPFGRIYVVSAAGGEPRPLGRLPGVALGAVPSRRTVLLGVRSPRGDRIVEATLDGKMHDVALRGTPPELHWDVATAASPSGRYVTWFDGGEAWKADLEAGTASPVPFTWPSGEADSIQPDDQGRVVVAFRRSAGQLYRVRGTFP
ncbi:MAG TPA: protein kinase [Polyangiaceae bacterium]